MLYVIAHRYAIAADMVRQIGGAPNGQWVFLNPLEESGLRGYRWDDAEDTIMIHEDVLIMKGSKVYRILDAAGFPI